LTAQATRMRLWRRTGREGDMEPLEYSTHCEYCNGIGRHLPGCPDEIMKEDYEDDRGDYLED